MQTEQINILNSKQKNFLRVATLDNEKKQLFYLYIGKNEASIKFLLHPAISGVIADTYENARKIILSDNFNDQSVDFIVIDLPYSFSEVKSFYQFLQTSTGYYSIPVLYNEQHFPIAQAHVCREFIDDTIDLNNWENTLSNKIAFLKKVKNQNLAASEVQFDEHPDLFKRAFDIVVSFLLLILTLPLFLIIALAIKLESRGPIFYNAKRAGKGFKIFKFYKFRTMIVNADKKIDKLSHLNQYCDNSNKAKFFKIANDPRVTRIGKFLRNTSLDELPQLFNVLKGDMSLVGNRPLPLYEAATLTTNECVERFMAPAGITGLWQIEKRGKAEMSIDERIQLDISYARKGNFLYDFWIMAKTPAALFQKSDV